MILNKIIAFLFLDVQITRGCKRFSRSVFRIVTFSGVFTNIGNLIFKPYKTGLLFKLFAQMCKVFIWI